MKFSRRFYDASVNFRNISKGRWILSVVIGLVSAYFIYSFIYVLREVLRVMVFGFENYPNIISDFNRQTYNLFFAGLSLIYGNAIAITCIFSRNYRVNSRHNPKIRRVINDQIFLNGGFAQWSLRMGLFIGTFSIGFIDFEYMPYVFSFGGLLLVVLYLETWKAIIQILKKRKYLWLLGHFLLICLLAFGLSFVNPINYKVLDALALEHNPKIDVPSSHYYSEMDTNRYMVISFKLRLDAKKQLEIILEDGSRLTLEELPSLLEVERASKREELRRYLVAAIWADKKMPMQYILDFQNTLCRLNLTKIMYVTTEEIYATARFETQGITVNGCLPYYCKDFMVTRRPSEMPDDIGKEEMEWFREFVNNRELLVIDIGKDIKVDGLVVPDKFLVPKFKNNSNPRTLFEYHYTLDTPYEDYIKVLSAHYEAAFSLRKENQTIHWNMFTDYQDKELKKAYDSQRDSLREAFPVSKIDRVH
ncbi:MAG: hypothetical protein R2797_13605 [Gelidibacter sp.]